MPNTPPRQRAQARRALVEDVRHNRVGWLKHGVAALAVSVLGLGVAGSLTLTGNAQNTKVGVPAATSSAPAPALDRAKDTSRSVNRAPLDATKVKSLADQRAEELAKDEDKVAAAATDDAVQARDKKLKSASAQAQRQAARLVAARLVAGRRAATRADRPASNRAAPAPAAAATDQPPNDGGKTCLPVAHYSVAGRFGQVGAWARYHTGFDFAAPVGSPLRAPAPGVVTNAGGGPASGWAGNYVAIKYSDGTQSLMAHMSTVSVSVGQRVSACQNVGAIGMTGRTFGPHVHFEIYPAGITPGDVYRAVDPVGWLKAHGLNP